jgi:hypothetical protein
VPLPEVDVAPLLDREPLGVPLARQQRLANTPGAEASEFAARQPEGD